MKTFEARLYYSGYCTRTIQAESENEAWEKLREVELTEENQQEILGSLEEWAAANEIFEIDPA